MNFLRCLFGCFSFILSFFGIILLFAVDMKYKVYPAIIALLFGYMSYRVFKKGKEKENSLVSSISESHISQVLTDNAGLEEAALSTAIVEKERRKVPVDLLSNFPIKQTNISKIPKEILELLWIKDVNYTCSDSMILEPSLIDSKLEIIEDTYLLAHPLDIGYYPSYANLSPGQRFVYLNWLTDITQPIPIGYVFIFYYGLERHLISGNFEAAFNMIVKLRNYHTNQSFYSYSSEAMLISLLQHKRHDLISHIDLNKANPKLVQFVLATLTGGIDSVTLIENCREVQFTNKRYINDCYELFKQTLEDILNEKYGVSYYPVDSEMFFNCTNTFPLILANFSLNTKDRLVAAPDLISNRTYLNDVYNLLSETHEKVKAYRREQRKEQTVSKKQKNLLLSSEEKVSELQQLYSDVEAEYNQLISLLMKMKKFSLKP